MWISINCINRIPSSTECSDGMEQFYLNRSEAKLYNSDIHWGKFVQFNTLR